METAETDRKDTVNNVSAFAINFGPMPGVFCILGDAAINFRERTLSINQYEDP